VDAVKPLFRNGTADVLAIFGKVRVAERRPSRLLDLDDRTRRVLLRDLAGAKTFPGHVARLGDDQIGGQEPNGTAQERLGLATSRLGERTTCWRRSRRRSGSAAVPILTDQPRAVGQQPLARRQAADLTRDRTLVIGGESGGLGENGAELPSSERRCRAAFRFSRATTLSSSLRTIT
jgi:hypothetical protein